MAVKSWEVSDEFWARVAPLIPKVKRDPKKSYQRRRGGGRKPMESRRIFEAIIYVLRTGIQWKALPKEYGSSSSVHRYFRKWESLGFFRKLWKKGLAEYDEMEGIKNGTKRHILVDERGVPLSIVVTGANRHDVTQVDEVLKNRIRKPRGHTKQHLCADAGYSGEKSEEIMRNHRYIPHIRPRGEEKIAIQNGCKARRWIVEVAHSWFNRFRKLLVRYEKYEKSNSSYEALLHLAATVIIYRKLAVI